MNEHELERRFRSVTDGPQPNAPQSLRHFLHDLPETQPIRRPNPLQRLFGGLSIGRPQFVGAGVVALAVVAALLVTNFAMSIRNNVPAATPSGVPAPTPLATFQVQGVPLVWRGIADATGAVPDVAVKAPHGYLGVAHGSSGGFLLTSPDGLHWIAVSTATVDPAAGVDLESIAAGPSNSFVLVGGRTGSDGKTEPAVYYSKDGESWTRVDNPEPEGVAMRTVAGNGLGYVAAGWSDDTPDEASPVWYSRDGRTWQAYRAWYIKGPVWLMAALDSFYQSGNPVTVKADGVHEYPPIWMTMTDMSSWSPLTASMDEKDKVLDAIGGTVTKDGAIYLVTRRPAGQTANQLVTYSMDAKAWGLVCPPGKDGCNPLNDSIASVAVTSNDVLVSAGGGTVYVSADWGKTWKPAFDEAHAGPAGRTVISLGDHKVLVTGDSGIWLGEAK